MAATRLETYRIFSALRDGDEVATGAAGPSAVAQGARRYPNTAETRFALHAAGNFSALTPNA